jgi:hypothetical protein
MPRSQRRHRVLEPRRASYTRTSEVWVAGRPSGSSKSCIRVRDRHTHDDNQARKGAVAEGSVGGALHQAKVKRQNAHRRPLRREDRALQTENETLKRAAGGR